MKSALIVTMGTSAPIVTEAINHLKSSGETLTDVILIGTEHKDVLLSSEFIRQFLSITEPRMRVHFVAFDSQDISSNTDAIRFFELCSRIIKDERDKYKCDRVHLCISGGRKVMCIVGTLAAQMLSVDSVFHVISQDVKTINVLLEQSKQLISDFLNSENKYEFFRKNERVLTALMLPPPDSYAVVEIPYIPYPLDYLSSLVNLYMDREAKIDGNFRKRLVKTGILKRDGKSFTEKGKRIILSLMGTE